MSQLPGDGAVAVTAAMLRAWTLPQPDDGDDKDARGRALVIGGSAEVPGSVLLAGVAALRAGAGKLQLATARSAATALGVAVPEARVVGLPEDAEGAVAGGAGREIVGLGRRATALVLGPGMSDPAAVREVLDVILQSYGGQVRGPVLVLDAAGIDCLSEPQVPDLLAGLGGRVVLTPNSAEMATLLGCHPDEVSGDPAALAAKAAVHWGAVVALKGPVTHTAAPDGRCFADRAGNVGLGTSGSGDVLAGVIGGLAARGADPLQAAVWGVHVHAVAGDRLASRIGRQGYLARELLDEVPQVLRELAN